MAEAPKQINASTSQAPLPSAKARGDIYGSPSEVHMTVGSAEPHSERGWADVAVATVPSLIAFLGAILVSSLTSRSQFLSIRVQKDIERRIKALEDVLNSSALGRD